MKLKGFEIDIYKEISSEEWCLCTHPDSLYLEIFLDDCEIKKKVHTTYTEEMAVSEYGLPPKENK